MWTWRFARNYGCPTLRGSSAIDVLHLIDRLDALLAAGTPVPMTGKVLVDRAAVLDLIDQIRGALPDDLQHAEEVLRSQEQLLAEARDAGQRIRAEAEANLRLRLDEHELTRAAREQARQILDQSQQQAREVIARAQEEAVARRKELDEYSLTLLRRLEASLTAQLANVRTGIDAIIQSGGRGPGSPNDS